MGIDPKDAFIIKALKIIAIQLQMSYFLIKLRNESDVIISFLGTIYFFPTFIGRILGKRTIVIASGSASRNIMVNYPKTAKIFRICELLNYASCNKLLVESVSTIKWLNLDKKWLLKKMSHNGQLYVDTQSFDITIPYRLRKNIVGYFGRFEDEKGIMNFVQALPFLFQYIDDIHVVIRGGGKLFQKIEAEINRMGVSEKVTIAEWIPQEELAINFNKLRLFVIPSYTEAGIPLTVLEAIACGVPVLAANVGGIVDVIEHGKTGFIINSYEPRSIAVSIVDALEYPNLEELVITARTVVEKMYSYEAVIEKYRRELL